MNKLLVFAALLLPLMISEAKSEKSPNPENLLTIELKHGPVIIELFPADAPNHVKRIKELAKAGKYDGVAFHRVIDGFMAQTGDVEFGNSKDFDKRRVGTGGSSKPDLKAEFNKRKHVRGTCSMARARSPHSANSQFFICLDGAGNLDGKYTIWGQVIQGMNHVDKIKKGSPLNNGSVTDPDTMKRVTVGSGKTGEKSL
ncbi:MAG: peptidylprolyl isomerase [Opitutae bacterium]|jgi:cyclophilin family peptidyl-prolyl cis-trans isomerase|nr:peptidylprolyl isomerase [Opitutae bacterium]